MVTIALWSRPHELCQLCIFGRHLGRELEYELDGISCDLVFVDSSICVVITLR